jgi:hypothetical protein
MPNLFRVTLVLASAAAAIIVTTNYYTQAIECLKRLKDVADCAVPTILAISLLYQVASVARNKRW